MALQVNITLTSKDSSTVPSGSHVKIEAMFPMEEDSYSVSMKVWRNKTAYDSGYQSYKPIEIPKLNYTKQLTEEEMAAMTPVQIHLDAKAYLETYVGVGNVTII